jgi:hypothetical protein
MATAGVIAREAAAWPDAAFLGAQMDVQRFLIIAGIALVVVGLAWPYLGRIGLGRLPGDIVIEREGFRLYIPIITSLLISAVLTLLLWLFRK